MNAKSLLELHQNDELWQPDPFREPRAWALAWDVTELLKRPEAPATPGAGLYPPFSLVARIARKEADARSAYSL